LAEILLDSDVIIAWLRGNEPFAESIPELLERGEVLAWTPISVAEIFAGARKGEERELENLFLVLQPIPLSADIGRKAGNYLRAYARSRGVELADALVAATAHFNRIPLWTLNRKHYPMRDIRFFAPPS
jgi:predicted nucleic acid-binding protein